MKARTTLRKGLAAKAVILELYREKDGPGWVEARLGAQGPGRRPAECGEE